MHAHQPPQLPRHASTWASCVALVCAALIVLLSFAGFSHQLHEQLHPTSSCGHDHSHDHDAGTTAHTCAITLFAQGVTLVHALPLLHAPASKLIAADHAAPRALALLRPHASTPPAQAPPV